MTTNPCLALALAAVLLAPPPSLAADDHGHDHDPAPAPATAGPLPRFAAVSELFELVGVLDGRHLTLYLDRAPDNSPVADAQIELDIGGRTLKAARHGPDTFEVELPAAPPPGVLAVTAMVTAGSDTDLLAGELDIHGEGAGSPSPQAPSWRALAGWAAAVLAGLVALGWAARRVATARRRHDAGAA